MTLLSVGVARVTWPNPNTMGLIPGRVGFAFCLVSLYNLMVGVKDRVQAEAYIQTGKIMVLDYKNWLKVISRWGATEAT